MNNTSFTKVITFVILVAILSIPGNYMLLNFPPAGTGAQFTTYIGMLMWSPAVAAIITKLLFDRNLRGMGWKLGHPRWLIISFLIPLFYGSLAYGILWLTGIAGINQNYQFVFTATLYGLLLNVFFTTGEEIGWRGFLMPELAKSLSYTKNSIVTGVIWSAYHFPLLILTGYLGTTQMAWRISLFVVTLTALTFVMGWLRFRSGSLWTAVLFHTVHNTFILSVLGALTLGRTAHSKYFMGESGLAICLIAILMAFVCWRMRSKLPN